MCMVNHIQIIFWTLNYNLETRQRVKSLIASNLKYKEIFHWRVVILNWPFAVLCRDPPILQILSIQNFFSFQKFDISKKLKKLLTNSICPSLQLEWRNRPYTKIAFELYKKCKKKTFCEQSASLYSVCLNKVLLVFQMQQDLTIFTPWLLLCLPSN